MRERARPYNKWWFDPPAEELNRAVIPSKSMEVVAMLLRRVNDDGEACSPRQRGGVDGSAPMNDDGVENVYYVCMYAHHVPYTTYLYIHTYENGAQRYFMRRGAWCCMNHHAVPCSPMAPHGILFFFLVFSRVSLMVVHD